MKFECNSFYIVAIVTSRDMYLRLAVIDKKVKNKFPQVGRTPACTLPQPINCHGTDKAKSFDFVYFSLALRNTMKLLKARRLSY